jgi:hypothetical protein
MFASVKSKSEAMDLYKSVVDKPTPIAQTRRNRARADENWRSSSFDGAHLKQLSTILEELEVDTYAMLPSLLGSANDS